MAERYPIVPALVSGDLYNAEELPVGDWGPGIYPTLTPGSLPSTVEYPGIGFSDDANREPFYYDFDRGRWLSFRTIHCQWVAHDFADRASNVLSGTTNFAAGDTVRCGPASLTYTARAALAAGAASEREFKIGGTLALSLQGLAAAIGGGGMPGDSTIALAQYGYATSINHLVVPQYVVGATSLTVASRTPGLAGNSTIVSVGAANVSDCRWQTYTGAALGAGTLGSLQHGGGQYAPGANLLVPGALEGSGASPFYGYYFPSGNWCFVSLRSKAPSNVKASDGTTDSAYSFSPQRDNANMLSGDVTQTVAGDPDFAREIPTTLTVFSGDCTVGMKVGATGGGYFPVGTLVTMQFKRTLN